MKREEKRMEAALKYANAVTDGVQDSYFDIVMKTHLYASKWADRTMIDRVCEWLKENMSFTDGIANGEVYCQCESFESFIEDFRKAMEK